MPVLCVDVVLVSRHGFLMGFRNNEPAKGAWWFPGGRVLVNEMISDSIRRKMFQELGITKFGSVKFLGFGETLFSTSAFSVPTHTVNLVFLSRIGTRLPASRDAQHNKFRWFKKIDPHWHPYLKEMLRKAGFR